MVQERRDIGEVVVFERVGCGGLLVTDEINPRSIAYQLRMVREHLDALPRGANRSQLAVEQQIAIALFDDVTKAQPEQLDLATPSREGLESLLKQLAKTLPGIDQALTARYLAHTELPKQFATIEPTRDAASGQEGQR